MRKKEWLNLIHQMVKDTIPNSDWILPAIDQSFHQCQYPSIFLYQISHGLQLIREKIRNFQVLTPDNIYWDLFNSESLRA